MKGFWNGKAARAYTGFELEWGKGGGAVASASAAAAWRRCGCFYRAECPPLDVTFLAEKIFFTESIA